MVGVDNGTDIAPLDNNEVLVLLVQLALLFDKRRHLPLGPWLDAPRLPVCYSTCRTNGTVAGVVAYGVVLWSGVLL
jgi:hypothetical protein